MRIIKFPKGVIGIEAAGIVRRVGSLVQSLRPGDHVAMVDRGVFSTNVITLENLCAKIPNKHILSDFADIILVQHRACLFKVHAAELVSQRSN